MANEEQVFKDNGYKFLGWENEWKHESFWGCGFVKRGQHKEYDLCKHEHIWNHGGSMHISIVDCPECKFYYKVDTS